MHQFEKKINGIIQSKQLLVPGETVVVGVSGGPDSTALLRVLSLLRSPLDFDLVAVYVDHGLRPAEVVAEKVFLTELCAGLDVPLKVKAVAVAEAVEQGKESIEQAARRLRYEVFDLLAKGCGASKIAVGHTADDQAEEVILRLLRGTARGGLSGMKLCREGGLIRPLLTSEKTEIYTYLQDRGQRFMEDSSNLSTVHVRNQVRLEILPFLRKYNPSVSSNLRNMALVLQDEEELLATQTDKAWAELVEVYTGNDQLPEVGWDCTAFLFLHVALQRRIAEKMFILMGSPPSSDKIKQLLYLIEFGQGGGQLHFAHGLRALKKKGAMRFWYPKGQVSCKGDLF